MDASGKRAPRRPRLASHGDHEWPQRLGRVPRRRLAVVLAVVVVVVASAVVLLARVGQLEDVAQRLRHANTELMLVAVALETLSFGGYVVLTRLVFRPAADRISWGVSGQIALAGVVATRVLTVAGAGGIALTVWALRAAGVSGRTAVERVAAFLVILYSIFFSALLVGGLGYAAGVLRGAPGGLALAAAGLGGLVIAVALGTRLVPRAINQPALALPRDAVALAFAIVRRRPSAVVAALAWWACDIAVLWTTFAMFGAPPRPGVLVLCYFLGQLAQVIPLPGGIGPVEGGMIAAFAACGVPVSLAILAVLSYQAISTWLPALPGAWAYVQLRRSVAAWRSASAVDVQIRASRRAA